MRAAWYSEFGGPEVLQIGDKPVPAPAAGEVQVRIAVSGLNPVDYKRRSAGPEPLSEDVVPHFDGAGVIEAVGEGVDGARVGQPVWVYEAFWHRTNGTAAEFCTVPADRAVILPSGADFAAGATFGIPALTAHRAVFADGPVNGQTVLVTGGAGAVGAYAIQFARLGGARVLSTVSSAEKAGVAERMGATATIDRKTEDVAARIMELTDGAGVDRIVEVDFGGNYETSLAVLKVNGAIAGYSSDSQPETPVTFRALMFKNITVRGVLVFNMPESAKQAAITDLHKWYADGEIDPFPGPRYALADIRAAHEHQQRGPLGNILIDVADL
ncbi:MAG: NADPH:quinone reductase [Alphaproteobacteria bacterium]